jgi:WD40 repeat protein
MAKYAQRAGKYGEVRPGPFKFTPDGKSIVGMQMPWLVLIGLEARREVRRVRPCEQELVWMWPPLPDPYPPTPKVGDDMRMAISPRDGLVATGCVVKGGSELVILDPELGGAVNRWVVSRPVQDLAWSPDGKQLAVLYYDPPYPWDPKTGKWVGPPSPYPVEPNVSIFDARSGKEPLRFNTGAFDAKIAFSPDGSTIYSICHHLDLEYFFRDWRKETFRAFDSRTGKMKKRIVVSGTGVRDNFAVSPDGQLIVAESTKDIPTPFWREKGLTIGEDYGFVILDSSTGDVLFREKLRRPGGLTEPLPLLFSSDGKQVVANFVNVAPGGTYGTAINVYSLGR